MTTYKEDVKLKKILIFMIFVGLVGVAGAFFKLPIQAWVNILTANFLFLSIALFGFFMLALTNIVGASFVTPYRKILEALAGTVPLLSIIMVVTTLLGAHSLYEWTHTDVMLNDKILIQKMAWLNFPFFSIRMVFYLGAWSFMSHYLVKKFREQEAHPEKADLIQAHLPGISAGFMVVFALTFCLASFDWIMSLEPHWFSTIFGIFTFSGLMVSGLATTILLLLHLQDHGYLKKTVTDHHYHDLGKLLFGFSTFWAYIWYSQYLLIWYANIPEEGEYYVLREHFGWSWLFWLNIVLSWVVPFIALLPRGNKRNKVILQRVSIIVLLGQWLNLYVMVAPKVLEHHGVTNPTISWPELLILVGYLGLFLFILFKKLALSSLVAKNSPLLDEGLALEQ